MSDRKLVGALLVTHGRFGEELVEAARNIVGETGHISFVTIGWHDEVEASKKKIADGVTRVDSGRGVIILTDMFGGTPSNLSLPLLEKNRLEIVTGVNLPMVVKLANQSGDESVGDLARLVRDQGQKHISIASELLGE
jgi:mannose PTS system EIIA component